MASHERDLRGELEAFIEKENFRVALRASAREHDGRTNRTRDGIREEDEVDNDNNNDDVVTTTTTPRPKTIQQPSQCDDNDINNDTVLLPSLPYDLILSRIVAPFIDDDTLHTTLPRLCKAWNHAINIDHSPLLWRRLFQTRVMDQWLEHGLLTRSGMMQTMSNLALAADFHNPFFKRKWVRFTGPYYYVQLRWKTTVRNMWTPKELPTVQITYHFRVLWFLPSHRCVYISTPCTDPDLLFHVMKKVVTDHVPLSSTTTPTCVRVGNLEFFWGTWKLRREGREITMDIEIPLQRYGVMYTFVCGSGGKRMEWKSLRTFTHADDDAMWHTLPQGSTEDLEWAYRPSVYYPAPALLDNDEDE